jgi:TolB protein
MMNIYQPKALTQFIGALIIMMFSVAQAQSPTGVEVLVSSGGVAKTIMALPKPTNLGAVGDSTGISEQVISIINKGLNLSGFFEPLDLDMYPKDAANEGLNPNYVAWYNTGSQGLIKVGYQIEGNQIKLFLKLHNVGEKKAVDLGSEVDGDKSFDKNDRSEIKTHVYRFVNEVIKHYTGELGFLGTRIAAVRKGGKSKSIYVIPTDGEEPFSISKEGEINSLPHFAKGRIYFTSYRDGGPHLFLYQGGKTKKIAAYPGLNMGASLSPDGGTLAMTLSKDGSSDIYLVNPDSGDVIKRLTTNSNIDIGATWSPDGSQIAFISDREGNPQIWLMNSDGSGQRRISFKGEYNQSPRWNPKNDVIVFAGRDENYNFDIFTLSVKEGVIKRLTQNQGSNDEPSWSPDGRHIAFMSTRSGKSEIWIMTADGASQTQLTTTGGFAMPYWER